VQGAVGLGEAGHRLAGACRRALRVAVLAGQLGAQLRDRGGDVDQDAQLPAHRRLERLVGSGHRLFGVVEQRLDVLQPAGDVRP
jgi:hypothetical protein